MKELSSSEILGDQMNGRETGLIKVINGLPSSKNNVIGQTKMMGFSGCLSKIFVKIIPISLLIMFMRISITLPSKLNVKIFRNILCLISL